MDAYMATRFTVVDDDKHILFFVERILRAEFPNCEISTFHDGSEALHSIRAANTDLVITDHKMDRMNGAELIRNLRDRGLTVPIVMISSSPYAKEEGLAAGATAYLEKDSTMFGLAKVVKSLLTT